MTYKQLWSELAELSMQLHGCLESKILCMRSLARGRTETFFHNWCSEQWMKFVQFRRAVANSLSLSNYGDAEETTAGTNFIL